LQGIEIRAVRVYLKRSGNYNKDVCQLFRDFEKAYDSIKIESLTYILIKFSVRIINTCLDGA
jgi:hypothetical protein